MYTFIKVVVILVVYGLVLDVVRTDLEKWKKDR
jgi:hypothetical protein